MTGLRVNTRRARTLGRQQQLLAIMANNWFQRYRDHFNFPANYTCFDLETNGLSPTKSQICSFGWTHVRDGAIRETREIMINWSDYLQRTDRPNPEVTLQTFRDSLDKVEYYMKKGGKPFHHTYDRMRQVGIDPIDALTIMLGVVEDAEARQEIMVAHNGWKFDIEFLQSHFHNWLGIPFSFAPDLVYDTGIAEKACQLEDCDDPLPQPGESLKQFSLRIGNLRRRIKWALDSHCDAKYGLFENAGTARAEAHGAGADSRVLCYLMEEHRKMAGFAHQLDGSVSESVEVVAEAEDA